MLINFREHFKELCIEAEIEKIQESVINKIKKLFLIRDPNLLLKEFKTIFDIKEDIKISKVSIGGTYNSSTKEITYSTNNSLIHELLHYLQNIDKPMIDNYTHPEFSDEGLLRYMLQPLELNNIALSFADDAQQYNSLKDFLKIAKKIENFENANRTERLKHLLYLLQSNISYDKYTKKYKQKFFKLLNEYYIVIKALRKDLYKYEVKKIVDII